MSATVIDGKAVAAASRERVAGEAAELTAEIGRAPGLATVLVGEDPASAVYIRNKRRVRRGGRDPTRSTTSPAATSPRRI